MLKQFFQQYLYIQLSPTRLTVRDPKSGEAISEAPEIAIQQPPGGKARILAVGQDARAMATQEHTSIRNPFGHPRSLISDFVGAEQLLRAFVRRVRKGAVWAPSPIVVMHPLGEHAGGLTQVEIRALRELAFGAGASEVKVWQGPALTDEQLLSGELPASGQVLQE